MQAFRHAGVVAVIAMALMGTNLGLAQGSELEKLRLGLETLKADFPAQRKYWAALSGEDPTGAGMEAPSGQGGKIDLEELSKQLDNPLGSLWILWMQNDVITLKGFPLQDTQTLNMTLIQPVLPMPLTKDYLWVNRPVLPFLSVKIPELPSGFGRFPDELPTTPPFGQIQARVDADRSFEFGDMIYLGMLAPKELPDFGDGKFLWGLGPTWMFPTATHDFVGSEKWSVGPGSLFMYMGKKIKTGVLSQHWWSFAGEDDRPSVSSSNIQPIFYYQLPKLWQIGTSPNVLVNWKADSGNKLTFPIGGGVNKTTLLFGKLPVRIEFNVYFAAIRPDDVGQRWTFRFMFIPVVPSAFKAMGIENIF